MKTIHFYGILAKKFGKTFELDVKTAFEATHALACQIPAFKAFMEQSGVNLAVFLGDKVLKNNINENEINNQTAKSDIHIVPQIEGAGGKVGGILQTVAGIAMIGVGVFSTTITAGASSALIGVGAGLLMGGVSSLLMPTPKHEPDDPDGNKANNGFGAAVTTVAQGNPVPILYGEREIGGFVISASVYAQDKMIQGVVMTTLHNAATDLIKKAFKGKG
ncbi:tail assembly protein [Moraxella nasovis]|uniref:tail assembly protein n=1 Tax=Moraxella nasovis TaxID=2904121 RepID=UPI001F61618B|nr:tail assembly protein [Moraxella nasovis]UNU73290.1 tail assembly protein [Moraxella nasovis]